MSNLAKLSKQAVQLEHDKQYEKALALFARLFDEAGAAEEEVDVALFNRAGDVAMRTGDAASAVRYYERAVDAYSAGGLLNNAIAVCNKMVRHAPEHAATHYTLGVLHAKQGFRGDAKQHFVEYAERMHRAGRDDESLRALGDFAALCPDGDDARLALGQHLAKGHRGTEVTERLQSMLAGAVGKRTPTPIATHAVVPGTPVTGGAAMDDAHAHALVFLDVSVDGAEMPAKVPAASLMELEPMMPDDSAFDLGPIDPVDLDSPVELGFDAWSSHEPAFEPLDLDIGSLDVAPPVPVAPTASIASAPRWATALPGELPMLSLAGWIGSASAVGLMEQAPTDVAPNADVLLDEPLDLAIDEVAIDDAAIDDTPFGMAPLEQSSTELHFLIDDGIGEIGVTGVRDEPCAPIVAPAIAPVSSDFVDLGAWLRDDEPLPSTRMTTDDVEPSGDESADFERMLGVFRAGVARNVEVDDYTSHYDLGVAFREMGLVDDAIAAFQKAARAPEGGLRAREALGQCFLDRGSAALAAATLQRALDDRGAVAGDDSAMLGVLYLLGQAHAQLGAVESARGCFERVVAADIQFRDAATRLSQLSALSP